MVRPLVAVCNYKSLRIFWMGKISIYMFHTVAPQYLLCCTLTLPGNGQFVTLFPYNEYSLLLQSRQRRPFLSKCLSVWRSVFCSFLYELPSDVGIVSKISCTYAYMISSLVSEHSCVLLDTPLGTWSLRVLRIPLGGSWNPTIKNINPLTMVRYPVIEQWYAWHFRYRLNTQQAFIFLCVFFKNFFTMVYLF